LFIKLGNIQFVRFCTVGLANTAVDFSAFFILNVLGMPYLIAQVIAYSAGVVNSYFFNRKWTFGRTDKANGAEAVKFIIVNGLSLLVSSQLLFVLYDLNHRDLWLAKLGATAGGIAVNFMGSRLWVFTKSPQIKGDVWR